MHICLIRKRWSATGGAENYLVRLGRKLREAGCSTQLCCQHWDLLPKEEKSFDQITELGRSNSNQQMSPEKFAKIVRTYQASVPPCFYFSMERGIEADIYRAGDGVHRQWLKIKRSYRPITGWLSQVTNRKNGMVCKLEEKTFQPKTTRHVIAISQMVKRNILDYFDYPQERITVIPNGVDFEYFSSGNRAAGRQFLGISKDAFVMLLVGHGEERKGHRFAREVELQMRGKARLVIIEKSVGKTLPDIYAAADLFLFPTLYDPFGSVVLEAMAAGLPVITTADCGASEVIAHGENGFVVERADEISKMKDYVMQLMNPTLRNQMAQAARYTGHLHSFDLNARRTLELCEYLNKTREK